MYCKSTQIKKHKYNELTLVPNKPLSYVVRYFEEAGIYTLFGPFDIQCIGYTEEEVISSFYKWLYVLWTEYALEQNDKLTTDAVKLKEDLINNFKEIK